METARDRASETVALLSKTVMSKTVKSKTVKSKTIKSLTRWIYLANIAKESLKLINRTSAQNTSLTLQHSTMKVSSKTLKAMLPEKEEHYYDPPATQEDLPAYYQYGYIQVELIQTNAEKQHGWEPGIYKSVLDDDENFKLHVESNKQILRISKYAPPICCMILKTTSAARGFHHDEDFLFGEQSIPVIRAISEGWRTNRSDNTWANRNKPTERKISDHCCEFIAQTCLAFTFQSTVEILEPILYALGEYELPGKISAEMKSTVTWADALEGVCKNIPKIFPFLKGQRGFKDRSFCKLMSAIVDEYVSLRYPGFSFNYQMEDELQNNNPIALEVGTTPCWSNGRRIPYKTWEATQRMLRARAVRPSTTRTTTGNNVQPKEGETKEQTETKEKAAGKRDRLSPEVMDHVIGCAFGKIRGDGNKKKKTS